MTYLFQLLLSVSLLFLLVSKYSDLSFVLNVLQHVVLLLKSGFNLGVNFFLFIEQSLDVAFHFSS